MAHEPISYDRHRFSAGSDPIRYLSVYMRFTLSYQDVEDLLAERGFDISYETWVVKFGPAIAHNLHCARHRPDDRWHLDEMVIRINGRHMYLRRAVNS